MVFDENISDSISLSRVLDHFMTSGEDPQTILDFLSLYKDQLNEVLKYSDTSPRLLSYGFLQKLGISQLKQFADALNRDFPGNAIEVAFLHFQILAWGSPTERNIFHHARVNNMELMRNVERPYSGTSGGEYLEFDRDFADADEGFHFANIVNGLKLNSLSRYLKNCVRYSTVAERLFQEDVFRQIDPMHQWVMLRDFPMEGPLSLLKGLKQILCSGVVGVQVKKAVVRILRDFYVWGDFFRTGVFADNKLLVDIDIANSFNWIAMKLELRGDDRLCDWILLYVLMRRGVEFLKPGLNGHRELFKRYFDIVDLLEAV